MNQWYRKINKVVILIFMTKFLSELILLHCTGSINTKAKQHFPKQDALCWAFGTCNTEFAHATQNLHMPEVKSALVVWLLPWVWSALKSECNMSMHAVEVLLTFNTGYSYCLDFLRLCFTAAVGNLYSYGGVGNSTWGCWGSLLTGNRIWQSCTALGALVSLCYAFFHTMDIPVQR